MEVRDITGYGRAGVAVHAFQPGDTVLEEEPLLMWQSDPESEHVLYAPLAAIVAAVNTAYEEDPAVHAVDTDSVLILAAYLEEAGKPEIRAAFVATCMFLFCMFRIDDDASYSFAS